MTQDWIYYALLNLGFKQKEAEAYVFLSIKGPHGAKEIAGALKINKRKVYRILKKLQTKEIVNSTISLPAQFSAVAFSRVLDKLIEKTLGEADSIEAKKDDIISLWGSCLKGNKPLNGP
jgi:sugar-specific transcriptional regulator TrmB